MLSRSAIHHVTVQRLGTGLDLAQKIPNRVPEFVAPLDAVVPRACECDDALGPAPGVGQRHAVLNRSHFVALGEHEQRRYFDLRCQRCGVVTTVEDEPNGEPWIAFLTERSEAVEGRG